MSLGSVKQNIIVLTASNLVIGLIEFVFNMYLSRVFGAEGLGLLSLITPINSLFLSFMTEGLVVTISKISARHHHYGETAASARTIKIATAFSFIWSLVLSAVLFLTARPIAVWFLGDSSLTWPILAVCPLMILMSISNIIKGHFLGLAKIKIPAAINISEKLLRFPILYFLIRFLLNNTAFPPITLVYLCYALGELQSVFFLLIYYRRTKFQCTATNGAGTERAVGGADAERAVGGAGAECAVGGAGADRPLAYPSVGSLTFPRFCEILDVLKPLIKGAVPICMTQCLLELVNAFSSVIVKARLCSIGFTTSEALTLMGMYRGMVFPLMAYPMILIGSVCSIAVPKISTLSAAGKVPAAGRLIRRVLLTSLLIGMITSVIFWFGADWMGMFFYKREDLALMIHLSGACAPLFYLAAATTSLLISIGREAQSFRNTLFQQLLLLIFLIIFTGIPSLNIYGYIAAAALSNAVLLVQNLLALKNTNLWGNHTNVITKSRRNRIPLRRR